MSTSLIMKPLRLPYFRDPNELPAPLPTKEEIQASSTIIKGKESWDTRRVVIVGQYFLVKYGRRARRVEGENLVFIEQNLQIQAPLLYAMWQESDGELYIIMELIPGEPLDMLWPTLTEDERTLILGKLRSTFDQMRALQSPGFYGSVTRGKVPHALFWTAEDDPKVNGPFETGYDLILGLAESSRKNSARNGRQPYLANFFEKHIARTLNKYAPIFSHTDLLRKNVIVRGIPHQEDSKRMDYEVSVIDWEDAGWYPAYWEYAVAFGAFVWHEDDWPSVIESIIDPWCAEATMLKPIMDDIWM